MVTGVEEGPLLGDTSAAGSVVTGIEEVSGAGKLLVGEIDVCNELAARDGAGNPGGTRARSKNKLYH